MFYYLRTLVVITIFFNNICFGFVTLDQAIEYAKENKEYPDPDNDDITHPDYSSLYKSRQPNFFTRLLYKLGIWRPIWSPIFFYEKLKRLVNIKTDADSDFTFVLNALSDTQLIILSDINSEFHSFVRILSDLSNKKIIDNNLRLLRDNIYIVFNGNTGGGSAYPLEVFDLMLQIIISNPDRVVYVKGYYENKEKWLSRSFGQELKFVLPNIENSAKTVMQYFNTLPLALYIMSADKKSAIRLSYYDLEYKELKNNSCAKISEKINKFESCLVEPNPSLSVMKSQSGLPIASAITNFKPELISDKFNQGWYFSIDEKSNIPYWAIISSPSKGYRQKYKVFFDAYSILTINKNISNSNMGFYYNDTRANRGFEFSGKFNLVSGKKLESK